MAFEVAVERAVDAPGFTSGDFRKALGAFATGVTVVTTHGEQHAYGMTANAFSSLSLDPPLVLVCARSDAAGTEHICRNGVFAVNVLAAHQEPISRYFSSKSRPRGRDAFSEIEHRRSVTGSPILVGVAASMDCRLYTAHEAGDHHILIGEVLDIDVDEGVEPLLFHGGRYQRVRADG
jgi:flavin reductase (DIM6/NTAB) family NADH-FMN oxidoreductase RutF